MGLRILAAAAREGKTEWAVTQALNSSAGLGRTPFILLPSASQVEDIKGRLASRGGALGVRLGTFRDLSQGILDRTKANLILLSEISQIRLIQSILEKMDLTYYRKIKNKSGFHQGALAIIRELEAGRITAESFRKAAAKIDRGGRLGELAAIYGEYRRVCALHGWADPASQIWIAGELLAESPEICPDWDPLIVDGFDDLSPGQLALIRELSLILSEVTVTVTGCGELIKRPLVHKRFDRLRAALANVEGVVNSNLSQEDNKKHKDVFHQLEGFLFTSDPPHPLAVGDEIEMVAVPDRESEVRTSLRWIKKMAASGAIELGQAGVISRNLEPYRKIIQRVAREYGLPVLITGGEALAENPAIEAVLRLLDLARTGKGGLAGRDLVSVWRSPYFDWSLISPQKDRGIDQQDHMLDTKNLSEIARWGSVIQGFEQWDESFGRLIREGSDGGTQARGSSIPDHLPRGVAAEYLWNKFNHFIKVIEPPEDGLSVEQYIQWIENLLGEMNSEEDRIQGLDLYSRILQAEDNLVERDLQAIKTLVGIFREEIWAEKTFGQGATTFADVVDMLLADIKSRSYKPYPDDQNMIVCADCTEVRGRVFRAVALMGLAEGEFPGTIKEDPFLRDEDRALLRDEFGMPVHPSTESAEAEFFYEAVNRTSERLLITRPRIADNGTPWQASPYWEELLRVVDVKPLLKTSRSVPALEETASRSEIFEVIAVSGREGKKELEAEAKTKLPDDFRRMSSALEVIASRSGASAADTLVYDGNLESLSAYLQLRFPTDYVWSPSRLENYQVCPFYFFVNNLLGLENPEPPQEGLDARQLGNIYHHIMEDLYLASGGDYDIQTLFKNLPESAGKVFERAPIREGFRETSWWHHTQQEILTNIRHSLIILEGLDPSFRFYQAEQKFGISDESIPQLDIEVKGMGRFHLRGLIDRVDINAAGDIRIIDYKTSNPSGFDNQAVREGKKLQLPLYALAAQRGLQLGNVKEGFYFHVRSAQASSFKLSGFWNQGDRGPEAAIRTAQAKGWQAVDSIRKGKFTPKAPGNGCPEYCPALVFCWHYQRQGW